MPEAQDLRQTTNTSGLEGALTGWVGIKGNVFDPPAGQTRLALAANIRHALAYCFQPQDEIIRRQQLCVELAVQRSLRERHPGLKRRGTRRVADGDGRDARHVLPLSRKRPMTEGHDRLEGAIGGWI